jgi:hypothetical protein
MIQNDESFSIVLSGVRRGLRELVEATEPMYNGKAIWNCYNECPLVQ